MALKVIFRMFEGDVIALFPELPGDSNPYRTCVSYQHFGQHGAAAINIARNGHSYPATSEQYKPLLEELASIGYDDLVIGKRITKLDLQKRIDHINNCR
jgi:hypothetical protein